MVSFFYFPSASKAESESEKNHGLSALGHSLHDPLRVLCHGLSVLGKSELSDPQSTCSFTCVCYELSVMGESRLSSLQSTFSITCVCPISGRSIFLARCHHSLKLARTLVLL